MGKLAVSDTLLHKMTVLARKRGQPVDALAEELINDALGRREKHDELIDAVKRIAAMTPKDIRQTDFVEILREIRGE